MSFGDYGASASYAREVLDYVSNALNVSPRGVVDVEYMDATKSQLLG